MAGPSLGTAYVQIVASAQGIKGSLTSALSGPATAAGTNAGSSFAGSFKKTLVAAGIGTAIVAGFRSALAETGALQQSYLGGLDTLYGDAAEKAREYARAAQEAGISQNNYAEQAVSFGAALKQAYGGDTMQSVEAANTAILDMADNAAKMGTPLQSIQDAYQGFAKQNYTMLDNLKLGYGGTKTEMERLLADAEAISGVHYDISNLGDVYSAIHVIQGELGLTGVAAEEAQSTLTGSFAGMKAAWDNLLGNIGLGENVESSMQGFTESVSNYLFNNLIPTIGNIIKSLPSTIGTFLQTGLPQLMQSGMNLVQSLADGAKKELPGMIKNFITNLGSLSEKLGPFITKFLKVGLDLVKNIAEGLIKNIPTLIKTIPKIITNLANGINGAGPKFISTGLSIIKSLVIGLIKAIPVLIKSIPQIIKAFWAAFQAVNWLNLGKLAINGIVKGFKAAGPLVKRGMNKIKDFMLSPMKGAMNKIKSLLQGIKSKFQFSNVISKVKSAFDKIKDKITSPITKAKEKLKGIVDKIKGYFPFKLGKILKMKLPSFKLSTGSKTFFGKEIKYPTGFSVSWNAKAMLNPYMFSGATLFGAGEAGDEILYGRKALLRDISEATSGGGEIIVNLNYDASDDANDMLRDLVRGVKRYKMAGVI